MPNEMIVPSVITTPFCFLRVDSKKEHLEGLADGKIRFRNLSYYQTIEEGKAKHFNDPDEGLVGVFQAKNGIEVVVTPKGKAPHILNQSTGLTGFVKISYHVQSPCFCLHAIHLPNWEIRSADALKLDELRGELEVHESMRDFGEYVWIIHNIAEFHRRMLAAAAKCNAPLSSDFVAYVDFNKVHGRVPKAKVGYVKNESFKNEREFRYLLDFAKVAEDPYFLDVGSLKDISSIITFDELKGHVKIQHPSDAN